MAKLVDCRGMVCPQPLVETRREIKKSNPGEAITVVVDNSTSLKNILRFLEDNGVECVVKQEGKIDLQMKKSIFVGNLFCF